MYVDKARVTEGEAGIASDCKYRSATVTAQSQHRHSHSTAVTAVTEGEAGIASDCERLSASTEHGHRWEHVAPARAGAVWRMETRENRPRTMAKLPHRRARGRPS